MDSKKILQAPAKLTPRLGQAASLQESCYCPGSFPGCLALLIGAEPIECVPGVWPVLDEQPPTNRPVSSSANAASDIVIFFFIYSLVLDAQQVPTKLTHLRYARVLSMPKKVSISCAWKCLEFY